MLPDAMDLPFVVQPVGKLTVVEFHTASLMDPHLLERVGHAIYLLVDEQGHRALILDFTQVQFLSSQAIGILLTLKKKLEKLPHSSLVLCGVGPTLLQLLKITRLDRVLTIKPTREDALKVAVP
jgi:anti-sigma B factor antagonist